MAGSGSFASKPCPFDAGRLPRRKPATSICRRRLLTTGRVRPNGGAFVAASETEFFVHTRLRGVRNFELKTGKAGKLTPQLDIFNLTNSGTVTVFQPRRGKWPWKNSGVQACGAVPRPMAWRSGRP